MTKEKSRAPSYQFYPEKAIAGTSHLSDAAFKAYWSIVWKIWIHSEDYFSIKFEKKQLQLLTKLSKKKFEKIWNDEIMSDFNPLFRIEDNRLVCNGLRKERTKQITNKDRASKGGKAKAKQTSSTPQAPAKSLLKDCTMSMSMFDTMSMSKERERERENSLPFQSEINEEINHNSIDPFADPRVLEIADAMPRQANRVTGQKAIAIALESKSFDLLLDAAKRYKKHVTTPEGGVVKFTQNAKTFFEEGNYNCVDQLPGYEPEKEKYEKYDPSIHEPDLPEHDELRNGHTMLRHKMDIRNRLERENCQKDKIDGEVIRIYNDWLIKQGLEPI